LVGVPRKTWFDVLVTTTMLQTPLGADDRCDRCGARAYYRATLVNGELFFCGHHGRKVLPKLKKVALTVEDRTDNLESHA